MSVRKWMFAALAALSLFFFACSDASDDSNNNQTNETPSEDGKTYIEFQNQERFPARIYKDVSRLALFAEVPAGGTAKVEAEPNPTGVAFYPVFLLEIEGIRIDQNGLPVTVRVDEKKVNKAVLPALTEVETGFAYIKIENAGAAPLTFNKGNNELPPLDAVSSVVMPDETAAYRIEPGAANLYRVMENGSIPLDFPATVVALGEFNRNTIYFFRYDGNTLAMSGTKSLSLPLPTPEKPTVTAGHGSVTVTWAAVELATSYNVYCGASGTPPASPAQTGITGMSATITGLANGTLYYVWVQALTSTRTSPLSEASSGTPQVTWTVNSTDTFAQAVSGINSSTESAHTILLTESVTASGVTFTANVNKTITIKGDASLRSIANAGYSNLFTVSSGITLVLENNIWINGNGKAYNAVYINEGSFQMNDGSIISGAERNAVYVWRGIFTMKGGKISGNTISYGSNGGGGVYVSDGTFTMSGGKISGNTVATSYGGGGVYVSDGTFTMSGGKISGNTTTLYTYSFSYSGGGGVYVHDGTFTMSGGEISGNTTANSGGGVFVYGDSTFIKNGGGTIDITNTANDGKVVYASTRGFIKRRDTVAGPSVYLNSDITGSAGGWE
ncbi:MAG: fibronectin type III domain-containing protein [Treponema sp.]|nr:fibronectin type III domain-containing protein [Treponema sp.]